MDTRVQTPFSLDTPLRNGSALSSTMSPLVLEGVPGVPRPERPLPFPRRHLIDPRIKRNLTGKSFGRVLRLCPVLVHMEHSKHGLPHLRLRLRWPSCPPNFMSRIRLPLFVAVRQLGLLLDLRATTLRNRLRISNSALISSGAVVQAKDYTPDDRDLSQLPPDEVRATERYAYYLEDDFGPYMGNLLASTKGVAGILGGSLSMLEARIGHLFPKKIQ
jgi:hypothetical protein